MLTLICYILGYNRDAIFTIDIEETRIVSVLKDRIKEKMKLKEVATQLVLWKVDLPPTDDFQIDLDKIDLVDKKLLSSLMKLSDIFSPPLNEGHVHVLIKRPSDAESG